MPWFCYLIAMNFSMEISGTMDNLPVLIFCLGKENEINHHS